jgi:hypothetical protein
MQTDDISIIDQTNRVEESRQSSLITLLYKLSRWTAQQLDSPYIKRDSTKARRLRLLISCGAIFLVALGVRVLHWQDNRLELEKVDSFQAVLMGHYEREAREMLDERRILLPRNPVEPGDARMLMHPPGYSVLMLALYGNRLPAMPYSTLRLFQIICDAIAALLVFFITAKLLPVTVGLVAAMLVALSPHLAYYSLWLSPDSLAGLPILVAIYLIIRAIKHPRMITIIVAGLMLGLSTWLRTNALLLAPFLAVVSLFLTHRSRRASYSLVLIASCSLTIF